MSILFADVYDGIRAIRISKGVCEKDILNYVQEKAGGCMKVGNVLKTIRTLKKLVEDGCLIKCGNRYKFPPKKDADEKCDEEEEDEEEEDNCDENDGEKLDMENDECDEGDDDEEEDEDEDDEDDDEEENDDDDDDDDEGDEDDDNKCDDKEAAPEGNGEKENQNEEEGGKQCPETQPANQPAVETEGMSTPVTSAAKNTRFSRNFDSAGTNNSARKSTKDNTMMNQKDAGGDGEAIAFCVRDFMDSMANSRGDGCSEENMEIAEETEEIMKMPKMFSSSSKKRQAPRKKANLESHERFRSRSPISGKKRDYSHLKQGLMDDIGFTTAKTDILGQSLNSKMEIDIQRDIEAFKTTRKSPLENSSVPEGQLEMPNPSCQPLSVNRDGSLEKLTENEQRGSSQVKLSQMKTASYSDMIWYPLEDCDNRQEFLQDSSSLENRKISLCSVCEKKKRIS